MNKVYHFVILFTILAIISCNLSTRPITRTCIVVRKEESVREHYTRTGYKKTVYIVMFKDSIGNIMTYGVPEKTYNEFKVGKAYKIMFN